MTWEFFGKLVETISRDREKKIIIKAGFIKKKNIYINKKKNFRSQSNDTV